MFVQKHNNDECIATKHTLHILPSDLVRYQLLPLLNQSSAVRLTQSSQALFHTLRHKIHRTRVVTTNRFIKQSLAHSKHIGVCSNVGVSNRVELDKLLQHIIINQSNTNCQVKLCTLLHLYVKFNDYMNDVVLPLSLQTLTFGHCFNPSVASISIPDALHTLSFGRDFNQTLCGVILPLHLDTLTFGYWFNLSLAGVTFPDSLQTLTFGRCFNQSLSGVTFPASLQTLTFGACFNQSLSGVTFPASLKTLTFGFDFNCPLFGIKLPASLQTLKFGYFFNQSFDDVNFPESLHSLTLGNSFSQTLFNIKSPSKLVIFKEGAQMSSDSVPTFLQIVYVFNPMRLAQMMCTRMFR